MSDKNDSNKISLLGEVVSIYETEGLQYAKIHYDSGFVDIIFQEMQDVFLNDRVVINSKLEVEDIASQPESERPIK